MAKKDLLTSIREQRNNDKTDGRQTAKNRLSKQTTGEHKEGYKETTIKLRITAEEKARWQQKAKEQSNKPLSAFIREVMNNYLEG